jgi:DNA polymerase
MSESKLIGQKKGTDTPKCGGACKLNRGCLTPQMAPTGDGSRGVLVVAEAPGKEEDRRGVQLIGESGQLLREMLGTAGWDLDKDCRKTNAVICRPPDNATPAFEEINACRIYLTEEITKNQPRVIIPLGKTAVESVLGLDWPEVKDIGRWVGWRIPSRRHNAWICPTYHPAFLLRNPDEVLKGLVRQHLERALELADGSERPWEEVPVEQEEVRTLSAKEARRKLRDIRREKGTWAVDFETTGLKPDRCYHDIVSCALSNGRDTYAFLTDTVGTRRGLKTFCADPEILKIASNLKYEERWARAHLHTPVRGWWWDTMLAAHLLNNSRGVCSIKFQAFVRLGLPVYDAHISPYLRSPDANSKNRVKELDTADLLLYNGLDALLEFRVAAIQMKEMGYPWKEGFGESDLPGCVRTATKRGHRTR